MSKLQKWAANVHSHCIATQREITAEDAAAQFGRPASNVHPEEILNNAVLSGYFRRVDIEIDGRRIRRFRAIERELKPHRVPSNTESYFHGLKRVRSVFELGGRNDTTTA